MATYFVICWAGCGGRGLGRVDTRARGPETPAGSPRTPPPAGIDPGCFFRLTARGLDGNNYHMRNGRRKDAGASATRAAGPVARWCEEFEHTCRDRGIRVTPQRLAVYRALAEDLTHPTADQVHARLRTEMPSLSLATVYRILESLEGERLIRRVSTLDGVGRFDANLLLHQHLVCRGCGRMTDYDETSLARIPVPRSAPGFTAEGLEIRIIGLCDACRDSAGKAGRS
jgi:Fur family peroxide stress response transcriptional regulator